ncbi:MAG: M28 family peptidase [Brevundimonas sp.]|uniref:M28 family peptidase n=1 Tax=Brevundimonas sp. TaxID=1871086 RepID=UPI0027332F87|nr:M28 family peptidase [Brevundimonas sp.]MDP3405170.1 M28 family peptidase [Brevundimonas sp.]
MLRGLFGGAAALALALSAGMATAQEFSAERLSQDIRHISSDEFMGRYPGTEGERMTLAWLQAQYEAIGLEPGGPDGQWLQPVALKRYTPVEGSAVVSWTGPDGTVHPLVPGTDIMVRAATNDGRADIAGAGLVFAGYGIHAPERDWDDWGDIDVRGKVVIVLGGEPTAEAVTARFNGPYPTAYSNGWSKSDEAFRRGAVGVIVLTPVPATNPGWLRSAQFNNRQRTLTPGAADLEFSGSINHDTGMAWAAAAGLDPAVLTSVDTGTFKAVTLNGLSLSVRAEETIDTLVTHNLLARIPGTTHPDETIVYSAHWDHVGVGADHVSPVSTTEDNLYNGAWDNASGTVGVVEMARQMAAAPRPERSIIFAHMAAEEMGLLGAYGYVANPVYPLETTVADINIDMLPLSGPTRDIAIFGKGQNSLEDSLQALADAEGRVVTDDRQPEQGFYTRSDHFPFVRAGVPALMMWHGVDWDEGGVEAGQAAWSAKFAADYHKPSDEWSADWDLRSAVENLTLMYRLGMQLANSDEWPTWKEGSEYGARRAASDAARQ